MEKFRFPSSWSFVIPSVLNLWDKDIYSLEFRLLLAGTGLSGPKSSPVPCL